MARLPAGATRGGVGEINLVGGHGRGGVGRRWSPTAFFPGFSRPLVFFGLGLIADVVRTGVPRALEIREGDHVCLVGKTLAERMQHFNRWETLLHQRFPRHRLVVCNLAWPADEVVPRPRAEGFGTPEEHLTFSKTDVVLAFFGFNESFAGPAGVAAFKKDLGEWVAATLKANYSGKGAPQLALVSPIAHENLRNPNLPDGAANNRNLELYTTAMREVAAEHGVVLGDVFHPTQKSSPKTRARHTRSSACISTLRATPPLRRSWIGRCSARRV